MKQRGDRSHGEWWKLTHTLFSPEVRAWLERVFSSWALFETLRIYWVFLVNKKNKSSNSTLVKLVKRRKMKPFLGRAVEKSHKEKEGIPGWGSFFPWEGVEGGPHILGRSRPIRQAETNREWGGSPVEGMHCTFLNKGCVGSGIAWRRRSPPYTFVSMVAEALTAGRCSSQHRG